VLACKGTVPHHTGYTGTCLFVNNFTKVVLYSKSLIFQSKEMFSLS
jgi:hypothetical protein